MKRAAKASFLIAWRQASAAQAHFLAEKLFPAKLEKHKNNEPF